MSVMYYVSTNVEDALRDGVAGNIGRYASNGFADAPADDGLVITEVPYLREFVDRLDMYQYRRDPQTGDIIGNTPFMDSLMFIITMTFLVAGIGYGFGAGTFQKANDVIDAAVKTFAGLAGLILMLLMIAQFIAFFNYSQMPAVLATMLSQALEGSPIGTLPLLIGFILVIMVLDIIMPGLVPKWAIFAPIFIPLMDSQGVPAQTVLAAYRIGDSPMNVVTPLMVYLPFMVTIAQRYQKDAGIGTIIALMSPYVISITVVWVILFVIMFLLGIPVGPGYPIQL